MPCARELDVPRTVLRTWPGAERHFPAELKMKMKVKVKTSHSDWGPLDFWPSLLPVVGEW